MTRPAYDPGYDPDRGPDPEEWLEMDEGERSQAVERWAESQERSPADALARAGAGPRGGKVPNQRVYAVMLATVETQVAHGDELPVAATLARLRKMGMSRREAVHAVATILAETTYDAFYGESGDDPETHYFAELATLTPESWRGRFDDDAGLPIF